MLKVLGRDKFESFSYVSLFDGGAKAALTGVDSVHMLLDSMEAFNGVRVRPGKTLLCIDEIQEIPDLLTLLKALREEMPDLHVAVAGSYLGMAQHEDLSFPVGSVALHRHVSNDVCGVLGSGWRWGDSRTHPEPAYRDA